MKFSGNKIMNVTKSYFVCSADHRAQCMLATYVPKVIRLYVAGVRMHLIYLFPLLSMDGTKIPHWALFYSNLFFRIYLH